MPIFEVTDPKTGRTVELESKDSAPPSEQELEEVFGSLDNSGGFTESSSLPIVNQDNEQNPQIEHQNIIGQTFNVPGATARSAIRENPILAASGPLAGLLALAGVGGNQAQRAAGQGAANPSKVQTFQDQAISVGQNSMGGPSQSVAVNFMKGLVPSTVGLAADMATDPTNVLMSILPFLKTSKIKPIAEVVDKPFMKAVNPSTRGIKNKRGIDNLQNSARSAVESIVDNKKNLKYTDELGGVVEGKLPDNLDEFSQAISQTKKGIFNKYDTMLKEAGKKGATVPLRPIADDILNAVASRQIEDLSPTVQNYGLKLADSLQKRGTYTLTEAQDAIEGLNHRLKSYFSNPTPEALHQAVIDRAVVNNLKNSLVKAIENEGGANYSILRKQYGHLSAVEDSVTKAALRHIKSNGGIVGKMFDALSSADIISGMLTLNPRSVLRGGIQYGFRKAHANITNPNNTIRNMFSNVDKVKNIDPQRRALKSLLNKVSISSAVSSTQNARNQ